MKFTLALLSLAAVFVGQVMGAPTDAAAPAADPEPVLPCANDAGDVCPPGYTCCGPIRPGIGGVCRNLGPDLVCIF